MIVNAQNSLGKTDDVGRVILSTVVPHNIEGLNSSSQKLIKSKLSQVTSRYGIGSSKVNGRFIITANVNVLTKDVTATAPPMHAYTLDVGFYIGDGIDGTLFSSTSFTVKGVGQTETKAYRAALKNIKSSNPVFESFISEGKNKIIEYYNSQCDFILKSALSKAHSKQYDEAMLSLTGVPDICKECFMQTQDTLVYIYKLKMENECQEYIAAARASKANNQYDDAAYLLSSILPDLSCYNEAQVLLKEIEDHRCSVSLGKAKGAWAKRDAELACTYLSEISVDSECYEEGEKLSKSISSALDANAKRKWDLAKEKYNREQTYKENQGYELEQARISANMEVQSVSKKSTPKQEYNFLGWW